MANKTILRVEHLTKKFPGVIANDDITLELHKGEILALMGENGAGKSTFSKMLTGFYAPTSGKIFFDGKEVHFQNTIDSVRSKISMVYQERNLVPTLTGAQNIWLANEPHRGLLIDEQQILTSAEELKVRVGIDVPLNIPVERLGAGEQQMIEILRAFNSTPEVLILDEPTACLGADEVESFLNFVVDIRDRLDIGIIFISHKIEEVYRISDRIAVFTDGRNVLTDDIANISQERCIQAMLRNKMVAQMSANSWNPDKQTVLLDAKSVTYDNRSFRTEFQIHEGEIVGFYGLVGAGRTECFQTIFGIRKSKTDQIDVTFQGRQVRKPTPRKMIDQGFIMTPEKRSDGIFKFLSLSDNIIALFMEGTLLCNGFGFCHSARSNRFVDTILKENGVKFVNRNQPISSLSGGNIQKIVIGRSVAVPGIKLLVLDEPANGMDIGAKNDVYKKVLEFIQEGSDRAVAFISSEIEELLSLCDTIYVFAEGNTVARFDRMQFNKAKILEVAIRGGQHATYSE